MLGVFLVSVLMIPISSEVIDLSQSIHDGVPVFDGLAPFKWTILHRGHWNGVWYESNAYNISEHTATHCDSPRHILPIGSDSLAFKSIGDLPVDWMLVDGVKVDLENESADRNYRFSVEDLKRWENQFGLIPAGSAVLVYTGQDRLWSRREFIDNGAAGINGSAARWLAEVRKVWWYGTDTGSLDAYGKGGLIADAHLAFFTNGVYGLEILANLPRLPNNGFKLAILPMAISGGSGAPARVLGFTGDDKRLLSVEGGIWTDLTLPITNNTVHWGTTPPLRHFFPINGDVFGVYLLVGQLSGAEHAGTHLDSPAHFAEGKWRLDEIPVDRLFVTANIIDVSSKCANDRDYLLTVADVEAFEAANGRIASGTVVLMRTDWTSRRLPDLEQFWGTKNISDPSGYHFPGFGADAVKVLIDRGIVGVGIDGPSVDYGQSKTFEVHQLLGAANVYGLENLVSLDKIDNQKCRLIVGPIKFQDGSGGPARVLALHVPKTTAAAVSATVGQFWPILVGLSYAFGQF